MVKFAVGDWVVYPKQRGLAKPDYADQFAEVIAVLRNDFVKIRFSDGTEHATFYSWVKKTDPSGPW